MNSEEILKFLGLRSDDVRLISFLASQGVDEQPVLEVGDFNTYIERQDEGYSLVYTDEAKFLGMMDTPLGSSPLIFTGVFFYSDGYEGYAAFTSDLPQGLSFSDNRDTVTNKLGVSSWQMMDKDNLTVKAERWDLPNYRLRVNYARDRNLIGQVYCGLPDKT